METQAIADIQTVPGLQDKLALMMANAETVGYFYVNADNKIRAINQTFLDILKFPEDVDVIGMDIIEALARFELSDAEEDNSIGADFLPKLIEKGRASNNQKWIKTLARTNDGRHIQIKSWFTEDGEFISGVRDITESKKQKRLLDMAMKAANAGYWSLNYTTGKYTYSQSLLDRLTPGEFERIQSNGLFSIIHRDDMTEIVRSWQEIMDGNRPFDITYRIVLENEGAVWQQSLGALEYGADGSLVGVTAFNRDITEELAQKDNLIRAERASSAKSEFLARMSHEIRTPLNAIIGMADSLQDEELTDDVRGVIDDIEQAADGLHKLLSKTLDHSKLLSNKMEASYESEDPRNIIKSCEKLWKPQASNKGLILKAHIDDKTPELADLDSFRIQQCLNNLLSNAIKFTNQGRIDIVLRPITLSGQNHLVFAVKDTGIGMNEAETDAVFKPFVQADDTISRKYGGTGLGVSIAKQMAELMGGTLRVKSKKGEGTTFAMIIPQKAPAIAPEQQPNVLEVSVPVPPLETRAETASPPTSISIPPPAQVPAAEKTAKPDVSTGELIDKMNQVDGAGLRPPTDAFSGLSVLCVEDNLVNQRVVQRLIGKKVTNLSFAGNGVEALQSLGSTHYDVVLMDIHMPIMNGIEATMEIRESGKPWANVAIIALTADPDYQQKTICRNIGMNGTIAKPVRRKDILDAFDQVLQQQWKRAG